MASTRWWMGALVVLALAGRASGEEPERPASRPTTVPATAAALAAADRSAAYEQIGIRGRAGNTPRPAAGGAATGSVFSTTRIVLGLGTVVGVVFAMKWAGRRFAGLGGNSGGGVIEVLARSTVSPRQQLILIQVGNRVVLAASSGAQMNALCEINDAEEIASLVGQAKKSRPAGGAFMSVFGRAQTVFEEKAAEVVQEEALEEREDVAVTRREIGGLLDRVKLLSRQFRRV